MFYPDRDAYLSFIETTLRYLNDGELSQCQFVLAQLIDALAPVFAATKDPYLSKDGMGRYHRYHFDQHSHVMIALASALYKHGEIELAEKIYFFNRATYNIDWYPANGMPRLTGFNHGSGSVIGRFGFTVDSSLYFCQGCTIGSNIWFGGSVRKNSVTASGYPELDGHLTMLPHSQMIGSRVEGRVVLAGGACAINEFIGDLSICFGRSPALEVRQLTPEKWESLFAFRTSVG